VDVDDVVQKVQLRLSEDQNEGQYSMWRAFKEAPFFAVQAFGMFVLWFCVSFVAYGINLNWKQLTGKLFLSFAAAA